MEIKRFINAPVSSNCYVLYDKLVDECCVVVDPGTKDCAELLSFLDNEHLSPEYIMLTHEHFDHVWGSNLLRDKYGAKIVCSYVCAQKIGKPQNYFNLLYYNDITNFQIKGVDIIVEDIHYFLRWHNLLFSFIITPGHSSSSICVECDNYLFSGDTVMLNYKPFIKKRHEGSWEEFVDSLKKIFNSYSMNTLVYPGHGDCFRLGEVKNQYSEYLK